MTLQSPQKKLLAQPERRLVHQLFETQVEESADAIALCFGSNTLSYNELNRSSNRFASFLISQKITRGAVVGVCLDRSPELLAVLLGILKAGAVYLPLDPAFPTERLNYMATDAEVAFLVTQSRYETLVSHPAPRFAVEKDWDQLIGLPDQNPALINEVNSLAYIIYTSGSTGQPKGVKITHDNVCNFLLSMARVPGLSASDNLLAVTTISFDIHVLELFLPLTVGATVYLVSQPVALDAFKLKETLEEQPINIMQATPATWRMLINSGWQGTPTFKVLIGGEALPKDLIMPLLCRSAQLWNMYGPTETTVWSTCYRITDADAPIYIGKPIDNTQVYIVNQQGQLVTGSEVGEVYIGGRGVSAGYHNRPELTAQKFIPNHFADGASDIVYRTGDLALYGENGNIEHLGRADNQVKVRGFRIELGEVEAVLAQHPHVQQAVVDLVEVSNKDSRLVAFFVAGDHTQLADELRLHSSAKLPHYMVPQQFVRVEEFPLTPNLKIDRQALVQNYQQQISFKTDEQDLPDDDLERALLLTWRRVLNNSAISMHHSFVEAGGESILAFDLLLEIRRATGIQFPYEKMLENPTVKELAESVASERLPNPYNIIPLQSAGNKAPLYCLCGVNLYQELAQNLGQERPTFGIYSPQEIEFLDRVIKGGEAKVSVEELAELYCEAILQQCPSGPIQLLGFSFGGIVAIETARLLQLQGKKVSIVVLVDSVLPNAIIKNRLKWATGHCHQLMRRASLAITRTLGAIRSDSSSSYGLRQTPQRFNQRRIESARDKVYSAATATYVASNPGYAGDVVLIKARDHALLKFCDLAEDYGWSQLLDKAPHIHEIAGEHLDALRGKSGQTTAHIVKEYLY